MSREAPLGLLLVAAAGAGAAAGCVALEAGKAAPTLPILEVAARAEKYRGEVVRTCGPEYKPYLKDPDDIWALMKPAAIGYHPAYVLVVPCPGSTPISTNKGRCITGKVARLDGSLTVPAPQPIVVRSAPISEPWYVHEQCRVPGKRPVEHLLSPQSSLPLPLLPLPPAPRILGHHPLRSCRF